jgi:glycerophosphoryl diester phosphodiesterase
LEAFREARRLGADMVELDARRTADGVLVVHHDASVRGRGPIVDCPAADLPGWLPALAEAVEACEGMAVNVEVKNLPGEPDFDERQATASALAGMVGERGWHQRILVSSFNLAALDRLRALEPTVATASLTLAGWDQHQAIATAAGHGHRALHPQDGGVDPAVVEAAHRAGLAVHVWTVDDPVRITELADMGVDGICTNVPDVCLLALERTEGTPR